jgi:hypothetical protein
MLPGVIRIISIRLPLGRVVALNFIVTPKVFHVYIRTKESWERLILAQQAKNRLRILINSGFFENHRCFFQEFPQNVPS